MDLFITAAAITALIFAWKARGGLQLVEQRLKLVEGNLDVLTRSIEKMPGDAGAAPKPGSQALPEAPLAEAPHEEPAEPPAPVPSVPAVIGPAPPAGAPSGAESLEEALGTRWAVWVGGAAVALGALLMVRHSIEQGWFGPEARLAMGGALALVLVAAGEWLRRREPLPIEAIPAAHIPSMLTATGTIAAFGTIYAAHAVYGFIGPALAFILLGAAAIATMLLAAVHGPALAGLGLAGSLVVPMLVRSPTPNPWPLVIYLVVVAAAAYALARARRWLWLAVCTVIGAAIWSIIIANTRGASEPTWILAAYSHLAIQALLAAALIAVEPHLGVQDEHATVDPVATLALAVLTATALAVLAAGNAGPAAYILFVLTVGAILAIAGFLTAPTAAATALAGVLAVGALVIWPEAADVITNRRPRRFEADFADLFATPREAGHFLWLTALAPLLAAVIALYRLIHGARLPISLAGIYAATATITPLLALIVSYLRVAKFEPSVPFALIAALLSLAFTLAMEHFRNRERAEPTPANRLATGALATAAIAALSLALVLYLERGYLTVALALTALGTAFVGVRRDLPVLRTVVAALGLIVLARIMWDPLIMGTSVGTTPVLNWLLVGYGVPALCFWGAARLMRPGGDDTALRVTEALSVLFAALLVIMQIRHYLYAGDVLHSATSHVEQGLMALVTLGFAAALTRLDRLRASPVFYVGALAFGVLSAAIIAIELGFLVNPYWNGERVMGPPVASSLMLAYLAPAAAALVLKEVSIGRRPDWYVRSAGFLALALVFAFVTLEVRHLWQGERIDFFRRTSEPEHWTYSAAWLLLGIAFLAWGVIRGSREARLASAVVVVAAVLKVFLFDLAALKGIWRPLSLIGLGLVLLGIARVYQRLIFARPPPAAIAPRPEA